MKKYIWIIGLAVLLVISGGYFAWTRLSSIFSEGQVDLVFANWTQKTIMLFRWYEKTASSSTPFMEDPSVKQVIQQTVDGINSTYKTNLQYQFKQKGKNAVLKTMMLKQSVFYCDDTITNPNSPILIEISGNNFTSSTDCSEKEF